MNLQCFSPVPAAARRLWNFATRNSAVPADLRSCLSARLLAAMLLAFVAGFAVVDIFQSMTIPEYRVPWYGYCILFGAFFINRLLSYRIAAMMTCLMFPAVLFSMFFMSPTIICVHSLSYLVLGIMLATLLLRTWEAVVFIVLVLALLATLPMLVNMDPTISSHLVTPFAMSTFGAVLSIVFSVHRDLLERRRQVELAASERRYRQIVQNFRGIAYEAEAGTFRPVLFEGAVEEITGYTPGQFLSGTLRWDSLIHPEDIGAVRAAAAGHAAEPGPAIDSEYRIVHADGSIVWVRDLGLRVRDNATGAIIYQGVIIDVTETHQLHERLRQSEKMEAVGQLAGGVAHDFNNQLAGIVGFAELVRYETMENTELAHYADNIIVAAKRAADLTTNLLAFARKGKFLVVEIDLHKVILEVVSLLRRSIDKRIEIRQQLNADPSCTLGDPTQVQNALLNLAINARDAMPEGGILTFSTDIVKCDEEWCRGQSFELVPGPFVRIVINDTGTGIEQKNLRRIFEPFYTTKPAGKGTGMGLAAVYGTVKNHHGAVLVDTMVGKGSTFTLYLPLLAQAGASAPPAQYPARHATKSGRILVVDDEELVLEMASSMLVKMGHATLTASNGKQAVELFKREHDAIDLVVLDLAMPVMAGPETFDRLRAIDPCVKVIIASGYSKDGIAQGMLEKGASGFVQKPFRREDFARAVDEALKTTTKQ